MGIISPYSDSITRLHHEIFLLPFFLWDWLLPILTVNPKPRLVPMLLLTLIMVITVTLDTTVDMVITVSLDTTVTVMVDTMAVDTDTTVARNVMPRLIPLSLLQPLPSKHLKFTLIHTPTDILTLTMLLHLPSFIPIL